MSNVPKNESALVPESFSDGIANIVLYRGVVRFDLTRVVAGVNGESKEVTPVVKECVIMPLEGFLKSFEGMQAFLQELVRTGVLKKDQSGATGALETGIGRPEEAASHADPPNSPNFV